MRGVSSAVVLVLFFLLQALVSDKITFRSIGPDFPLLIVSYFALFRGAFPGSIFGFVVGFFQDLFNPSFLGLNALTKTIVGYALGRAGAQTERDNPLFLFGLFGVTALGHDFVYLLFFTQLHLGKLFFTWATVSIPSAVYTALVGACVHTIVMFSLTEVVRYLGKTRP
jgi:rod shape-determining protein MreD